MTESSDTAERLYELRALFLQRCGPLHPIISELSPTLQLQLLETALSHDLVIDAVSTERALEEIRLRGAKFLRGQSS